jgi:retron-type reverse transcriptase
LTSKEVRTTLAENKVNADPITLDYLLVTLKSFIYKRAPGVDKMNTELIKKASHSYLLNFWNLLIHAGKQDSFCR